MILLETLILDTREKILELAEKLKGQAEFSFDTETVGLEDLHVRGCSFSWDGFGAFCYFGDDFALATEFFHAVRPVFENENVTVVIQNAKFDNRVLKFYGIRIKAKIFDTLIAAFILDENERRGRSLDKLAERELGIPPWGDWYEDLWKEKEKFAKYGQQDAEVAWELRKKYEPQIKEQGLWYAFRVDCALLPALVDMEDTGCAIDKPYLEDADRRLTWSKFITENKVYEKFGKFNMSSPKQIAEVLKAKGVVLPVNEETGNPITAEWALLAIQKKYPIVNDILRFRSLTKTQGTYVRGIMDRLGGDMRLHSNFNLTNTVTGRLSSSNPNLQNLPRPGEDEFRIRDAFVATPGYVLIDVDESQLELRLMAHRSGDALMLKVYNEGIDIHSMTAEKVHCTRQEAKPINFGLIYGMSPGALADTLGISKREAQLVMDNFFDAYPGIKKYINRLLMEARITGFVRTMSGRKRRLPDLNVEDFGRRGYAERQATNTSIQGSASDILKRAQIEIHKKLIWEECRILVQVHDELLFECKPDLVEKYLPIIKLHMEHPFDKDLRCPLIAEHKQVLKWGKAK